MNDVTEKEVSQVQFKTYGKSWTVYVRLVIVSIVCCSFALLIAVVFPKFILSSDDASDNWMVAAPYIAMVGWCMLFYFVLRAMYRFFNMRALVLYTDGDGVWINFGFLPWQKGKQGVRWEDMDSVKFRESFLGWVLNSCTVVVTHRFTKSREFSVRSIRHGKKAVEHIGDMHKRYRVQQYDANMSDVS